MKKEKYKENIKFRIRYIILILSLIIFSSLSIISYAWFTDQESYSSNLNFGNIKLKVSGGVEGDGTDSATSKLVFSTARKKNNDDSWTGKYMPGDTIELNLTVELEENSEPAYYVVQISDEKNFFENNIYFSEDGENVYVYNGTYTYKQNDSTKTMVNDKWCGKITAGNLQNLTISAKISEDYETKNERTTVYCKIFAIQQANLEPLDAFNLMPTGFINVSYGNFALNPGNGTMYASDHYFATTVYIPIGGFEKIVMNKTSNVTYFVAYVYDGSFNYVKNGGRLWGSSGTFESSSSDAKYFSIEFNNPEKKTLEECLKESQVKLYGNCEVVTRS